MSTILESTDAGYARYRNLVAHSLDHGRSWQVLAEFPDDLSAETIEVAASDPKRIYVTGTANSDPLQGIVERSDDGGLSWKRTTVRLPRGRHETRPPQSLLERRCAAPWEQIAPLIGAKTPICDRRLASGSRGSTT